MIWNNIRVLCDKELIASIFSQICYTLQEVKKTYLFEEIRKFWINTI